MSDSFEAATIRLLPDGSPLPAKILAQEGDKLSVVSEGGDFQPGVLVEIDCQRALYLGEVIAKAGDAKLTIAIEHFVDRAALDQIVRGWGLPEQA